MDLITNLPAEKIEEICRKLDNRSLSRFMETSKRVHNICYDMYLKREEKYLEEKKRQEQILENLRNEEIMQGFTFWVVLYPNGKLRRILNPPYLKPPGTILIPEIKTVGKPEVIRLYLANEGLNQKSIERLMRTAVH